MAASGWSAVAAALLLSGCGTSAYVTPIGPPRPSRPEGCALDLFEGTASPPYPTTPIARARIQCDPVRRNVCAADLRTAACVAGADAIVGIKESMFEYSMFVDATYVVRGAASGEPAVPVPPPPITAVGCEPICSPGFTCRDGRCIPVCNPPCGAGEICNRHRACELAPVPTSPSQPSQPSQPSNEESVSPQVVPAE